MTVFSDQDDDRQQLLGNPSARDEAEDATREVANPLEWVFTASISVHWYSIFASSYRG